MAPPLAPPSAAAPSATPSASEPKAAPEQAAQAMPAAPTEAVPDVAPMPSTSTAPPSATMQGYPDLSGIKENNPGLPAAVGGSESAATVPVAAAPVAPSGPRTYALDPAKSSIYVQVYKDPNTIAQGLSHDHVVAATGWSGSVVWDRARTEACAVQVSVPVLGLVNDALGLRKRVGYDTTLTDDQRAEVKEHMLAPGQLDAANFPKITFVSTSCSGTLGANGDGAVTVAGMFTLHGVAKAIAPKMTVHVDDHSFTARGSFTVNTTDFGFAPYTALLGALKNNNALKFTVDVVGSG